jgi:hypothetical protein
MPFISDVINFYHGPSFFFGEAMGISFFLASFYFGEKLFCLKTLGILKICLTCSSKEFD